MPGADLFALEAAVRARLGDGVLWELLVEPKVDGNVLRRLGELRGVRK